MGVANSGKIQSATGSAISSSGGIASFVNNATGTITSSGASGLNLASGSSLPNLDNKGTISTTSLNTAVNAVNSLGNITGAITNSGSITAAAGTGLALLGSTLPVSSITNSGVISSGSTGSGLQSAVSIVGNLTNTSAGSITSSAGNGLNLTGGTLGGSLLNSGIISSNGAGSAIASNIPITGDIVNNGTGSITSANGMGLDLGSAASLVNLNNLGTISTNANVATVNAVNSLANITGALTNEGSITAFSGTGLALLSSTLPLGSITNSGTISSSGVGSGIESKIPITGNITNDATKMISSVSGSGLNLSGGSLGGSIVNNGTLSSNGAGSGLLSNIPIVGNINNNALGSITSANGNALNLGSSSSIANLNNLGTISTNAASNLVSALNLSGNVAGNITNSGIISANSGPCVNLVSGIVQGSLTNTNSIVSSGSAPAIILDAASQIKGGIINSGTLESTLGSTVVDLSSALKTVNFVNNVNGLVTGDVKLSQATQNLDSVFQMNGGTITGAVIAAGGIGASTLNIAGGAISNGILLSPNKADVINQLAGQTGSITGSSGSDQVLNVIGNVVTSGAITNVDNIIVPLNGQLIVDHAISGLKTLTLKENPINLPNIIDNMDFITDPGTTLDFAIQDINNFGHMVLNGATNTLNNTNLKVTLTPGSLINTADEFKIVDSLLGPITGQVNLLLPQSATLSFSLKDAVDGLLDLNSLILIATRLYETPLNVPGLGQILLDLLDTLGIGLTINSDLLGFLSDVDQLTSQEEVLRNIASLAPPANGGMPDLAQRSFRKVLTGIFDHLYYLDCPGIRNRRTYENYPAGAWTRVLGDYAHLQSEEGIGGYSARSGSIILGYDGYYSGNSVAGAAFSYSQGETSSQYPAWQTQKLWSYQLTGYLSHDWGCSAPFYVDLMGAVAYDEWSTRREIGTGFIKNRAHASFEGWHYGADLESGYRVTLGKQRQYQLIPLVKIRYSNLDINDYTELGTGLALEVENDNVAEFVTGAGLKFRRINKNLIPEFRVNVFYDWIADPQNTTSKFIAGGDSFVTHGYDVDALTYNVGLSLGGEVGKNIILALSYDADFKSHYVAQTGAIKLKYEW